jgi:hypothetical protein
MNEITNITLENSPDPVVGKMNNIYNCGEFPSDWLTK